MEMLISFLTIFVSLLLVIMAKSWRNSMTKASTRNLPPGPSKLPIIGNLHRLVGSLAHRRLYDLAKKYGPIMHLQLGQISTVIISSPELAKEVMKTHDLIFASRPTTLAATILTYNSRSILFSPYGDYWRRMRKLSTVELLNAKRLKSFESVWEEVVSNLVRSIASNNGVPVNLSGMVLAFAYSNTSRTAFGKTVNQDDAFGPVFRKVTSAFEFFNFSDLFPSIKILEVISGLRYKLQKIHKEVDTIIEDIIKGHRERKTCENTEGDDLIDVLLNIQDRGELDMPLTTQDIKATILEIFLGGVDTTATSIDWAMSEMVKHPMVLTKAQAEVRRAFNGKERIREISQQNLKYLNSVIKETLRLHPPGPLLPRKSREEVEICGYKIPEGTQVIVNAWGIGRDSHYWTEPERFYPERFLNKNVDYKGLNFEYVPFGAGRRICPGMPFAVSIVELVLANLLYHFDWRIPDGIKPEDLDMSECPGFLMRRRDELCLIPTNYEPK